MHSNTPYDMPSTTATIANEPNIIKAHQLRSRFLFGSSVVDVGGGIVEVEDGEGSVEDEKKSVESVIIPVVESISLDVVNSELVGETSVVKSEVSVDEIKGSVVES